MKRKKYYVQYQNIWDMYYIEFVSKPVKQLIARSPLEDKTWQDCRKISTITFLCNFVREHNLTLSFSRF